jgi:outer membrane protein assembly factor BamD
MMTYRFFLISTLAAILFVSGCGTTDRLQFENPEAAYNQAMVEYERGRYERAAEAFRAVFTFGRAHEYAANAQWYLAMSHYNMRDYIIAASEFSRFSQLHRADPRMPEAEFMRGMAYYEQSPGHRLDQTDTFRAIEIFQLFLTRFPQHEKAVEAQQLIAELRNKLARKQYESGTLYERRTLYQAAALSYERTFDLYPDTDWADNALVGAMRAYLAFADLSVRERQPERLQLALDNYNRLIQIFPDSPLRAEAEQIREQVAGRLQALDAVAQN